MKPNDSSQGGGELQPTGPQTPSQAPHQPLAPQDQQAAANVLRSQINSLYETQQSTYDRVHEPNPVPNPDQWKAYHSAWQDYYQKYYAAYYAHQAHATQLQDSTAGQQGYFSTQSQDTHTSDEGEDITKDQALFELRQKLLGRVRSSARTIRRSRHFVPIAAAVVVVLIFAFLQYNRVLIASVNAYISPGSIDPQNIVIDPTSDTTVSADPRLIIPKINVDVPVIYDTTPDHDAQMAAMEKGVAHFAIPGANSHPGEVGNAVLSGHSSNDLFDRGDYKFIFAQLDKLAVGDTIYANYKGKRYTYVVTKTEVVQPTNVQALIYPTTKPVLTLITCTPLGTALNRLLVTAEQVSPDPGEATAAPEGSGQPSSADATAIPGSSPTLFERLFGAR